MRKSARHDDRPARVIGYVGPVVWVRRGVSLLVGCLLVLAFVGASPAAASSSVTRREWVAVAHIDPLMTLAMNVVAGRLKLSGDDVGEPDDPVLAIHAPSDGGRLFLYGGGIPGLKVATHNLLAAGTTGRSRFPDWRLARLPQRPGRTIRFELPDGRTISVTSDERGRVVSLRSPADWGGTVRTTFDYAGARTDITDPFGVTRSYLHNRAGYVRELVPRAWRGPAFRRWRSRVLDSRRTANWIQNRASLGRGTSAAMDLIQTAAGATTGTWWFDAPANGGYLGLGLDSRARLRRVLSTLRTVGLLDIAAIYPAHNSLGSLNRVQDALDRRIASLEGDCHAVTGQQVDDIDVSIASTTTHHELRKLIAALRGLNAWIVIRRGGSSECAVATVASPGR
jgi:hypothetical protein